MTEHAHHHHHDEDSACSVAHSPVAPAAGSVPAERTLVAVFASPVAGYLLRYGADMGFRGLLLEPDEARAAGAAALGFPLLAAVPDDLDGSTDVVLTDHHRPELGVILRDALATKARWVGIMGNPSRRRRSPACTGRSGSTSAPASRPRSPSPRWPASSLTATAGPGDLNSDQTGLLPAGIIARYARLQRIASRSLPAAWGPQLCRTRPCGP